MWIGLMPDVPHDAIFGRIEYVMQRDGEFDRAEIGGQMTAGLADRFENEGAQFVGDLLQTLAIKPAQRARIVNAMEKFVHVDQKRRSTMKSASARKWRARSLKDSSAACASRRNCSARSFA